MATAALQLIGQKLFDSPNRRVSEQTSVEIETLGTEKLRLMVLTIVIGATLQSSLVSCQESPCRIRQVCGKCPQPIDKECSPMERRRLACTPSACSFGFGLVLIRGSFPFRPDPFPDLSDKLFSSTGGDLCRLLT